MRSSMKIPMLPVSFSCVILNMLAAVFLLVPLAATAATTDVDLASEPMFDMRNRTPPNILLSLSIDTNSVGAAYRSGAWATYDRTFEYQGYFNPAKCYGYSASKNYFDAASDADKKFHECDGKSFSGNFMNWASMSTLDLLRYGLTGGDRIADTASDTVLQRAVLPAPFFNSAQFPARSISASAGGNVSVPAKVTPFSTSTTISLISCENKIIIADASASISACAAPTKTSTGKTLGTGLAGEYLVRVKVCDATEGPLRTALCVKIGNNYKPVGSLQRNAEKMRFGVMSYLPGVEQTRYGGVLRSPMKFLGPKKYAETGAGNPEWDAASGILYTNPDDTDATNWNSTSAKSGMINFINQFGRGGAYKDFYDPLSELYYEGIRYFQGKKPSTDATAGLTEAMKEGFPVITNWSDPVLASCQRNEIVVVADANTNYDFFVPGNTNTVWRDTYPDQDPKRPVEAAESNKTPVLDVNTWTKKVGDMEVDKDGTAGNPSPDATLAGLDQKLTGYLDYGSYYISGLAYWANTNDIRLDKPVRVKTFVIDTDEGGSGSVDFATRSPSSPRRSQLYLAAKYGGFDDVSGRGSPFVTLAANGITRIEKSTKQWDADGNGKPDNYFLASQPNAMVDALQKIPMAPLPYSGASLSAPAVSSPRISPGASSLYQAGYRAPKWTGWLKKLQISAADATSPLQTGATPAWEAGELLTGTSSVVASPTPDSRNIYTAKSAANGSFSTVEFKWVNLSADQQTSMNGSDAKGDKRLNYLRGVRTDELGKAGGTMRVRESILGDIVNSNVKLVGAPVLNIQGSSYKVFYDANKGRDATLYVGANDGMLHAFDAGTGAERFAYVPSMLLPQLSQLSGPDYVHRPYVDGQIAAAEARVGTAWKTVLASGLGGGARGLFALDVTNPANFSGGGALFEFTDSDDPDIGNLMGAPQIAKFRTGTSSTGVADYKYYVVVPGGINAPGALFLLSLDKPAADKWSQGKNYFKISASTMKPGLSTPALVVGSDGAVLYAYAGDLQGNLWRFDFSATRKSDTLAQSVVKLLFTAAYSSAKSSSSVVQPITTQPVVVFAPGGGYVVLFGTGKFLEASDLDAGKFTMQSFYAIYDTTPAGEAQLTRTALSQRVLIDGPGVDGYIITDAAYGYNGDSAARQSWYIDFPGSPSLGERQVTNSLVLDGQLYFNTITPGSDPCVAGAGRAYSVNALSGFSVGGYTGTLASVGFLSAPVVFQMGKVAPGARNAIGRRIAAKNMRVLHVGTGAGVSAAASAATASGAATNLTMPAGRFSWREIVNWQELRTEALKAN